MNLPSASLLWRATPAGFLGVTALLLSAATSAQTTARQGSLAPGVRLGGAQGDPQAPGRRLGGSGRRPLGGRGAVLAGDRVVPNADADGDTPRAAPSIFQGIESRIDGASDPRSR